MKDQLGSEIMQQLNDFVQATDLIGVSDEEMEAHLLGDDEEEEGSGVGISKTFEFGGIMKAEWGCKVTFEKSGKGVSKKVQCGGKYDGGSGMKEMADGTSFLDYFN